MHWEAKKNCVTHFIMIFALLWRSGTEPTVSPRYACKESESVIKTSQQRKVQDQMDSKGNYTKYLKEN